MKKTTTETADELLCALTTLLRTKLEPTTTSSAKLQTLLHRYKIYTKKIMNLFMNQSVVQVYIQIKHCDVMTNRYHIRCITDRLHV